MSFLGSLFEKRSVEAISTGRGWGALPRYRVDHSLLARAKEDMIVMHPLPRVTGAYGRTVLRLGCTDYVCTRN